MALDFEIMQDLAVKCKEFRKKFDMDTLTFASTLGVDESEIIRIENGLVPVSCDWFFYLINIIM